MKKIIITALSAIILSSCAHEAMESRHSGNPDGLQVELMFKLDSTYEPGVYRFHDGNTHYFVISPYGNSCSNTVQEGKYSHVEEVVTIDKK